MPRKTKKETETAADAQDYVSAHVEGLSAAEAGAAVNFEEHVYPPYHGEATHPDPTRLIVPITSVYRDPENARLHPERNLRHLRASLRRGARGQQTPINVDRTGKILSGNGRHEAAELEGWTHIWVVVSGLEGAEATGYAAADNASGLSSQWDFKQLAGNVKSVREELDGTGLEMSNDELCFEEHELGPLMNAEWKPPEVQENVPAPRQRGQAEDPHPDLEGGDRADNCEPIYVTPNMRAGSIDAAVERVRLISGDMAISEGRCIELICADYLSGSPTRDQALEEFERVRGTLPAGGGEEESDD